MRKKSGRKTGGQPGHPGRTLQSSDQPQHDLVHRCVECSCGQDLSGQTAVDFQRRRVFDLPSLQLECTEHRAEVKECPCGHETCIAPFPAEVQAPGPYGRNFRALLAELYDAQQGASLRIREMCAPMFGDAVSEATVQSARQEQHQALEFFEDRLREIRPNEPNLHADETSVPINQLTHWRHVLCTPRLTFFAIHRQRGQEAINDIGILPRFKGWLMTDFLSSYLGFDQCLHTFCKSHLLRELVFLFEQHQQTWAKDLHDLFLAVHQWVGKRLAREAPLTPRHYCRWNNEAERAFRRVKVRIKISGCFRTLEGARRHARIRGYISTLHKHNLPVLEYLRRALDGRPFLPTGAKST